ncbi:hypothetical protein [Ruegeria sp. HKCCA6837]|uniref:hypothetical protein n=1 Tax=Ruegeria sp. HKCCA6837 TaxID=2682989 RepID=UPI001488554D|nr:hypothetical protein [Ruegeria sp. HKCCA6837]
MSFDFASKVTGVAMCIHLAGCAQPAQKTAMVPGSIAPTPSSAKYHSSVGKVTGYGGEETNPMWTSEISKEDFQAALETSLRQAGIYSTSGQYTLRADILSVEQPLVGFDLKVAMTVRYNIIDTNSRILFDRTIKSEYTADLSEAFVGVERLQKANEGAARANIHLLLKALGSTSSGGQIGAVS